MKIETEVKAVPGDKVMVENYRSSNKPWEQGEVKNTKIGVDHKGKCSVGYDVWIERPANKKTPWTHGYYLHVGDAKIDKVAELEYAGVADEIRAKALISYDDKII